jgi:hypothetical protein
VQYSPGSVLPSDGQDGQIQSEEQQGENGSTRNPTTLPHVTLSNITKFYMDTPTTVENEGMFVPPTRSSPKDIKDEADNIKPE